MILKLSTYVNVEGSIKDHDLAKSYLEDLLHKTLNQIWVNLKETSSSRTDLEGLASVLGIQDSEPPLGIKSIRPITMVEVLETMRTKK